MQRSFDKTAVLPGIKPVLELLSRDPGRIDLVYCKKGLRSREALEAQNLCRQNGLRFTLVEQAALDRLCRNSQREQHAVSHQGIVARLSMSAFCNLDDLLSLAAGAPLPVVLALDQVQDPGNVGALARTLYILGGAGIILPLHNAARLGPSAHKAAAGALAHLPLARVANLGHALDRAEESGFAVYGTGCGGKSACRPTRDAFAEALRLPAVLALGNEQKGLRPGIAKRCGCLLRIPQARAFDSFNVAQAGAILLGLAAADQSRSSAVSFGQTAGKQ
ncbi:MAG: 23S rRNA (guanosine(2251)-2'-O)-methyltransferase RlmB [Desulfovibrio sp.]|jgi:23S rRNA (guanosine2251-2'-O)-methyltransferase|nr:23S rRNA (guanosine(2251)-2'-O)-methyltransferase RlmB [Desulfovibrio sp.]